MAKRFTSSVTNNSPNCVLIDKFDGKHYSKDRINIAITLNFNEEGKDVLGGHIRYALKKAILRLELDKCFLPFGDRNLVAELPKRIEVERQFKSGNNTASSSSHSEASVGKASAKSISGELSHTAKSTNESSKISETVDKFNTLLALISASGDKTNPEWHFKREDGTQYLIGCLREEHLGLVSIDNYPAIVKAFIKALPRDIEITASDGFWPNETTANKRAVVKAMIWHALLKKIFHPYVSAAELRCDNHV